MIYNLSIDDRSRLMNENLSFEHLRACEWISWWL